jgi:quinol monooxygenase YgiN
MTQIAVVAKFVAKPGCEGELEESLKKVVKPTQSEAGCIMYLLHRSTSDPSEYWFIEQWESKESLEVHARSAHIKSLRQSCQPLVSVDPLVIVLDPVGNN